jgi:hypothetical protein
MKKYAFGIYFSKPFKKAIAEKGYFTKAAIILQTLLTKLLRRFAVIQLHKNVEPRTHRQVSVVIAFL